MVAALHFTPDADANRLLASEPLAVMIGMLIDQQVPMEWAFHAPALLKERLGVRPAGWEVVAADWPSIADVDSFERVLEIREKKRAMKAAAKAGSVAPS